jgi:hypothetical protein
MFEFGFGISIFITTVVGICISMFIISQTERE